MANLRLFCCQLNCRLSDRVFFCPAPFFLQTSLVARPPISFDLCKERLYRRLKHHGIEVTKVMDEELCYIPMGGALPNLTQVSHVQSVKSFRSCRVMPCHAMPHQPSAFSVIWLCVFMAFGRRCPRR